jgi:hypothetical protein
MEDRSKTHDDASFRACAEECRRLAARATDPVERQQLHQVADHWLKLAQVAGVAQEHPREADSGGGTSAEGAPLQAQPPETLSSKIEPHEKAWLWPLLEQSVNQVQEQPQPTEGRQ